MSLENAQTVKFAAQAAESLAKTTAKLFESSMPEAAAALRANLSPAVTLSVGEQTLALSKMNGSEIAALSHRTFGTATMVRSQDGLAVALADGAGAVVREGRADLYSPGQNTFMRLDRNSVEITSPKAQFAVKLEDGNLASYLNGSRFEPWSAHIPSIGSFNRDAGRVTIGLNDGTELGFDRSTGAFASRGPFGHDFFTVNHNLQDRETNASIGSFGRGFPNERLMLFNPAQHQLLIKNAGRFRTISDLTG